MIARLDLRNFKAFERFTVHFGGDAYMVGPNNAGKSTLIAALRAAAHMLRFASSRTPSLVRDDGTHGQVLSYPIGPDQFGLVTENLRHEFHQTETRLEVAFSDKAILRAVWPSSDGGEEQEEQTGFFYLFGGKGTQPHRPVEVRKAFPRVGVVPVLSPIEHDERPLNREYVLEHFDGRLASRHFRNQLALLRSEYDEGGRPLFDAFSDFAAEWAPEITITELSVGQQINLYYRETGRRSYKEIFWAGDGYQVWLQLLLHLFRLRGAPSIVLDEPDVFLHADLQRRLVRLIESFGCQTITATHSPEMLSEAPPQTVIWVDKTRPRGVRAPSDSVLGQLSTAIGSQFNLGLAKALRAKVVLFVEGDDMKLLRHVASTVGAPNLAKELGMALIPLQGFSNWGHVEPFSWLLDNFLLKSVSAFVVLDRDYRTDTAVRGVTARLRATGVGCHVWKRKELESYFLHEGAIARLSGADPSWIRSQLLMAAEEEREAVFARMLDEYAIEQRSGKRHSVTVTEHFGRLFKEWWKEENWRLEHVSPSILLAALNRSLAQAGNVSVSFRSLSRVLRRNEIPSEMINLIETIEDLL